MPILNSMDFSAAIKNSIDIDPDIAIKPIPPTTPKGISRERLIALRKKNLSYSLIAKVVGIAKRNVVKRFKILNKQMELVKYYRENRSDLIDFQAARTLDSITPADRKKASLLQKTTAFSQLYDKSRLENDKSTQNIAYADALKARDDALKAEDLACTEQDQLKKNYPHIDFDQVTINVTP